MMDASLAGGTDQRGADLVRSWPCFS